MKMRKKPIWLLGIGILFLLLGGILISARPLLARSAPAAPTAPEAVFPHDYYLSAPAAAGQRPLQQEGECAITAVGLIGAWVDAGAPETSFPFTSLDEEDCTGDFHADVLPLFTTEDIWFDGSQACTECHFDNSEDSRHEMDLSSYEGILRGGDVLSKPPGEPIVIPGDWEASKLRGRLRDNRMPPGWHFDIEEGNRDGPLLTLDGGDVYAVDLIGAWVDAGAPDGTFTWEGMDGSSHEADFSADVLPLFTEEDAWFEGSQACVECHFDNSEDSRHEMDLSSYEGILTGGDVLSKPPGEPIIIPGDWEASKLRGRLRNNRMPPGWEFDIEEGNRDGPLISVGLLAASVDAHETTSEGGGPAATVLNGECAIYAVDLIGAWVDAGAPELDSFAFTADDGANCSGTFETDILPLFTEEGAWFGGSQACIECHFDNSEDSRHEMDLSNYEGIMKGGDVLSEPPGVPIIVPGDWDASKLRARLRNNRMPPGWEFDIEETNRDGPLLSLDGGDVYAVDLIGAWVNAGAPDGPFSWEDVDGNAHDGDFSADVLPLFTTEGAWFEGSQACIECHFDNSEDSRHEMDLSSYEGIMKGGDVLSEPPGVPIVVPGDWDASKLRARLRNNRMPPGWLFDIEETNRDGPLVMAGVAGEMAAGAAAGTETAPPPEETAVEPPPPPEIELPEPTITETITKSVYSPAFLGFFGATMMILGIIVLFIAIKQLQADKDSDSATKTKDAVILIFAITGFLMGAVALHAVLT
ncbi:MAG TPA: hypothetical protein ENJ93_09850, partial [Chloroflexi bacterium]|nr:hypothetical protein [Chloroflexota bacterium]